MKPRHFWWLMEDEKRKKPDGDLTKGDVRRLRRMMEKKQHELATASRPD